MAINKKVKALYDALKADGDFSGSEQEFNDYFFKPGKEGYQNRYNTWKLFKDNGGDVGDDYGEFSRRIGLRAVQPSSVGASAPLSEQRRAEMLRQTGNMMAGEVAGRRRAGNQMEFSKGNFGFKVKPTKIGQNSRVVETGLQYDANAGGMRPRYLTESGNEFTDRGQADLEQNAVDRYKYSLTVDGQLAAAEAEKERLDGLMRERMEELDEDRGTLGDIVRTLADESHGMPGGVVNAGGVNRYRHDERFLQLEAAARKNNLVIQTLRDKKAGKMNDFWHSVGTALTNGYTFSDGLSDMNDASALMSAQRRLEEINRKREAGEALTKEEEAAEAVLRNAAMNEMVQGRYGGDYGAWSRAGNTVATSVDMMKDILLTPGAAGLTKSVAKKTASALGKGIAKTAGEKVAENIVTKGILKGTGILVGINAGGALVSNTGGLGHTMGEMGKELSGRVEIDDRGNYKIEDQSGLLDAFVEAERRQIGENGSEMFGEFIPGMGGVLKKGLEKIGLSKISGALTNIGKRDWYKRYSKLLEAGGYNGLPGEALEEYEGLLFDAMTGDAGEVWEQVKDPRTHVDIWLGCLTMGALMGGVPMVVEGAHTAQYYRYRHGTKVADRVASYRMTPEVWEPLRERIDNAENGEMTDVAMSIFDDPDLDREEKKAALNYIRNLQKMRGFNIAQADNAGEEKNPEIEAANDSYSEGHGAAEILSAGMGEEHSEEEIEAARADVDAIKIRMQEAYDVMNDAFGGEAEYYVSMIEAPELSKEERDAEMWSLAGDPQLTEDQREAVLYYINARAALDGVMDASNEAADSKRAEVEESVRKRTHKDSGVIIPATMKVDNRQVYIVKNDVVMLPDGTAVDVHNSSDSVVVMDAETGKYQFASPDQIFQVSEALNPQEELEAAQAVIEQEQMEIFGDDAVEEDSGDTVESVQSPTGSPVSDAEMASETVSGMENGQQTALARIPLNESGEPVFEAAESADLAWDALVEFSDGDAGTAKEVADMMAEEKRKAFEKAQKLKPKGRTPSEIIASKREVLAGLDRAEGEYRRWLEIANVEAHRESEALMERRRIEKEELERRRAEEERLRTEREEAERRRIEELDGVPDMSEDTPQAARARGFRRVEGHRVDRQEPVERIEGKEVTVKFSSKESVPGRVAVIEAAALQPSHIQGLRNPAHFIDEAQPKERTDEVSVMSARGIANDIRPEEITGSVTAYMGAPTVNERGEVIQGNNRGDALRFMWETRKEQAEKYMGYLMDHAEEFGLRRDELEKMERPVLVNMIPVEDGDAIRLGQYVAGDTESGGLERIKPKNVVKRLGDDMKTFAKMLLRSEDDGVSFAGLVDSNGEEVMDWLLRRGFITQTQYASAFDSKGYLTAEAKNDLRGMIYQGIFEGGNIRLEEKFNRLPAKAQRALLATAWRDTESMPGSRMIGEIQKSILAFDALMEHDAFANAGNWKEARSAVDGWKMQYVMDDVSGESYLPGERFSDFALHLAAMYKGEKQSLIQRVFNDMYDLIQGSREETLFEKPDNTPRSLAEAINEVLNIEYNGKRRDDILVVGSEDGQGGGRGRDGDVAPGERAEGGGEPLERGGGAEGDSRGVGNRQARGSSEEATSQTKLSKEEATDIIAKMEMSAVNDPQISLSPESWQNSFGLSNSIDTPLGKVKMGEGQYQKLVDKKRSAEFGMVVQTLQDPDVVFIEPSEAKEGQTTERDFSYVFVKTFIRDGKKFKYYTSVSVLKDGMEVSVSSHIASKTAIMKKLQDMERAYTKQSLLPNSSEWHLAEHPTDVPDLLPTQGKSDIDLETVAKTEPQQPNNAVSSDSSLSTDEQSGTSSVEPNGESTVSGSEGTASLPNEQISDKENAAQHADVEGGQSLQASIDAAAQEMNTSPTPAQAEAGNYKKGHITIGEFDITIENPAGSVRKGVDADGKEWSTTMADTYGYIKGTEGVDGDHIDVFLHHDMDQWDGRKVFVVDQTNRDGSFDEHKVMLGFNDKDEAMSAYLANYDETWAQTHPGLRISETNIEDFNKWVDSSHRKTKPFADYTTVSKVVDGAPVAVSAPSERQMQYIYTIEPTTYTNKKGKTSDVHLVKFNRELTAEEKTALDAFAREPLSEGKKTSRGWYDRKQGGYMMRSEEAALQLAEMIGNEEAVADAQPMTAEELREAVSPATPIDRPAKQVKAEQEAQHEISDDEMQSLADELRDLLGIDEGDTGMKFRDPGELTPQERQRIQSAGIRLAMGLIERGTTAFPDYAIKMVGLLGDKIRPWLKSFYEGARWTPGYEKYAFTPSEEVAAFDVQNFDKRLSDPIAQAAMIVEERKASTASAQAQKELVEIRNKNRRENDRQTEADTAALAEKRMQELVDMAEHGESPYTITPEVEAQLGEQGKEEETHNGYRIGDEVMWDRYGNGKWEKVRIEDFEKDGSPIFETVKGVMSEKGDWNRVKPADGIFGEAQRVARAAQEKKSAKRNVSSHKKTSIKPEQPVADLFGGLFDESININNEKETDVQSRPGAAERERGHESQQNEPLGESQRNEAEGSDGRGMGGRDSVNPMSDGERGAGVSRKPESRPVAGSLPESERKNTRNNHAERGTDYAPKGEDARIKANIKAIELTKRLLDAGKTATPEQMAVLRKFSGWGGLGKAFNESSAWAPNPVNKRLREVLTPEEYEAAVMSRNSAFYTPAAVIDAMWDVAKALGFKGGNIVEGSAGIGNIIGLMPTDISERSNIHAVEIDPMTGGILSLLYPGAQVEVQGFEQTRIENGTVDLAITNVPFVTDLHVKDETGDGDLSKKFRDIHDFCIAKNVRKLREGGIGIFITSSGTLDKSQKLRNWLVGDKEGNADVVGVFRMNNQTFGGTAATSDIIVVRKRVNGRKSANAIDVSAVTPARTATFTDARGKAKDLPLVYNRYFVEHPEFMGGEMFFGFEQGDTYRPTSVGLFPTREADQAARMAAWVRHLADMDWRTEAVSHHAGLTSHINEALGEGVKEGSMVMDSEGNLCVARMGRAVPLNLNNNKIKGRTKEECFKDYTEIKSALAEVLKYQIEHEGDAGLQPLLDRLNRAYDTFVKRYGNLNKNNNLAWLRNDVDFSGIVALETYSEKGNKDGTKVKTYGKTDIFSRRVVEKESEPTPKNIKDGIIASIYKYGRIDPEYLATRLGKSQDDVKQEIVESGLGFVDPTTGQMEVSYEYLSGNVREKLRQAREANEAAGGAYDANVKALEAVVPMNIPAHLIEFALGSSWIEPQLYERYIKERTGLDVKLTNAGGTWHMSEPWNTYEPKNTEMGVRSEAFGILIPGHKLIEAALTNKTITVSRTVKDSDGGSHTETDPAATTACATKVDEIRQDFKDWAREQMQNDPALSMRMEEKYNEKFNNSVPKTIPDEFVPEHFGGAATIVNGKPFKLRPHQAKAVIRATTQPVLLAHEVGTGKTYTLITTAMEMRRLGTARKPMIIVQNATVGQFVASAKALYPNAKVLTLEDGDRNAEGRRAFYAKIKFNDWDMIVVPQSVFERIPDSIERQTQFIQDKIEEKMLVLEQMKEADPDGRSMIVRAAEREISRLEDEMSQLASGEPQPISGKKKKDAKKAAITRQNAEVKARELLDRATDDVEDFDSMGIDAILVDEAHEYKHLGFATAMQRGVKGVDPSPSKKSQGVFLKAQAVMEKTGGKNVVFATGTPISNTAAEIWTFMRYLIPADVMKEYDIYYFDDFVRNFGNLQQMLEFKTNGKYDEVNRFAGYVNLPELVRIWSTVADTVLTREAGGVSDKIPQMEGGKAQDIFLPQTRALRSIMKYVKEELDRYEKMTGKEKKENSHIPLVMYGIAKAAAVDARLVQSDAEDDPKSKTNEAVRQTLRSLEETKDYKGTVAIFADNYRNKASGFNLYEDIRKKLIAAGVPEEQVVVMKPGMTVKKKLEIFEKVNSGEIRVIMGSTFTLGTGVNIQERLHTLIHLDAPNRPMDYTQRNGRILRQGNLHNTWGVPVRVLRFGVEDSLDVTAYQRLKTKGAIADSIMNGRQLLANSMENRSLEEDQDLFGDITAQLSGSEYAMLKNQIEKEVRKLRAAEKNWKADQTYIHNRKRQIAGQNRVDEKRIADNRSYMEKVEAATIGDITVGRLSFPSVDAMEDFFTEQNRKKAAMQEEVRTSDYSSRPATSDITVSVGGFDFKIHTEITREMKHQHGDLFATAPAKMTYSCPELGIDAMPVKGNVIKNAVLDIMENVVSGKDFREGIESAGRYLERNNAELEAVSKRDGLPFKDAEALAKAEEKLAEYEELMKAEMAAKEAKYAEMDKDVEAASGVKLTEEDSTDTPTTGDGNKYRDGAEMSDGERLRAIRALKPIEVERNELSREELREVYNNLPSVEKDGREIEFYRSAFKKIYKEGGLFGQVVPVLDEVLEKSVLAYSEEDNLGGTRRPDGTEHKEHDNIIRFDNYVGVIELDGKSYFVRTTVQNEIERSGTHAFFVSNVDVYENPIESRTIPITSRGTTDFNGIVDAKLRQFFERAGSEANILDMRDRVQELSERLGTPVKIISDDSELTDMSEEGKPRYTRRERRAKGWWSAKDDEVVIVLPNNVNVADVENTFVHEVVGHKGLRALVGEERFDEFLGEIYDHASNPIRKKIDRMTDRMVSGEADRLRVRKAQAHEREGEDVNANYYTDMAEARVEAERKREEFRREATEEYMADMAGRIGSEGFEKMSREELTLWGRIKARVQAFLDKFLQGLKIAKSIRLTDKDLAYILYKSWKNMGERGVFAEAEDAVMRRRTGWDDEMLSESAKIENANNRFNRELQQQIDGTLPANHVYQLGRPGKILISAGIADLPIELSSRRLEKKASEEYGSNHPFDLASVNNLPQAINSPLAVFDSRTRDGVKVILTELKEENDNFVVAVEARKASGRLEADINSIRSLYPKDRPNGILKWIADGLMRYCDKDKMRGFLSTQWPNYIAGIEKPSMDDQQRTNLADVADLDSAAKVIETFENPSFEEEDTVRFRDSRDYVARDPVLARAMYDERVKRSAFQFREAMQDSMLGLKEFYRAVESRGAKRDIKEISSFENAYVAENLLSSRNHDEMEVYEARVMWPLLDIAAKLSGDKQGQEELRNYMMAKHGLERNAYMREEAGKNGENTDRDFSGLTGLTGEKDWQAAEAKAEQMVEDYESAHEKADIDALWEAVNVATKTSLKKTYDSGLLSKEQYERIRDMYQYYIPLRGFEEKTSEDIYGYLTGKGGAFSSPIRTAEGRSSKADDPLATIAYMAQNSIMQGNRNLMKQQFLTYVQNHPSDLASVNKLWLEYDEAAEKWIPVFADIKDSMSSEEVENETRAFEERMLSLSQQDPDKYKRGREAVGIPYRLVDGNLKEHQVVVKRNGESYVVTINGNPRAAQALNGLTNPDNDMAGLPEMLSNVANYINRQLSQFYTTRNPDFVVSNFLRDTLYANTMVHVRESQGYAMRFHKNHVKANPLEMVRLLYLYDANKLDMKNRTQRFFYEFMHWGGETGYTMQRDLEQEKKLVDKLMKQSRRGVWNPKNVWSLIGKELDLLNRGVENSARFAAFMTSREVGRDVQRAAYDAKEISVNFNKKGAGSKFIKATGQTWIGKTGAFTSGVGRSFYVFWNAAIQGTTNFGRAYKDNPKKAITTTTALLLLGYFLAAMNDNGDDEDKSGYYNMAKYIRRSSLLFKYGEQWIAIPLPVEYRAIYGLGELAYGVTSGREEYSDKELAKEITGQLSQVLPLDFMEGEGGLSAFVPTMAKPAVEAYNNTTWTGLPIYKDTPFNKNMPEWTKAYSNANRQLVDLSKLLNEVTGGNDYKKGWLDFNPAQLEYVLNGYFGGYSKVVDKMVKTGETLFGEREYDPASILLVNRIVKMGDERTEEKKINSDFYRYLDEYRETHRLLKKYEEEAERGSGKYSVYLDALRHSRDGARHEVMQDYISYYNRLSKDIKAPETSEEEKNEMEDEIRKLKREVVMLMKVAHDPVQMEMLRKRFEME